MEGPVAVAVKRQKSAEKAYIARLEWWLTKPRSKRESELRLVRCAKCLQCSRCTKSKMRGAIGLFAALALAAWLTSIYEDYDKPLPARIDPYERQADSPHVRPIWPEYNVSSHKEATALSICDPLPAPDDGYRMLYCINETHVMMVILDIPALPQNWWRLTEMYEWYWLCWEWPRHVAMAVADSMMPLWGNGVHPKVLACVYGVFYPLAPFLVYLWHSK